MNAHPVTFGVVIGIVVFILAPFYALRSIVRKIEKLLNQKAAYAALMLLIGYVVISCLFQAALYFLAVGESKSSWHTWYPFIVAVMTMRTIELLATGVGKAFWNVNRRG